MSTMTRPTFREMDRAESIAILARNHVGRVAFATGSRVDIVPVHYVYSDDWIYGRTAPGSRVERIGERWWPVAFQVDEVAGLFDWTSIVVRGGIYTIPLGGADWERDAWVVGLERLRRLIPEALEDEDPTPERTTIFRIAVQEISGRAASAE
jgi:uncharacterized protein